MVTRIITSGLQPVRRVCMMAPLVLAILVVMSAPNAVRAQERIVAVGDVHGDVDALVSGLQAVGVIDENRQWRGGPTTLVQLGDLLDRGLKGREVLDLYMALEQQAPQAGGRVVVLLGNHEVFNIMGDLRYVTNYTPFADDRSDERLATAYEAYMAWQTQRATVLGEPLPEFTPEAETQWMNNHYRGFLERAESLSPQGKYGAWLRSRPAVARIDSFIFIHGGISPVFAKYSVEEINREIVEDIARFDRCKQTLIEQDVILPFFTLEEMLETARNEKKALQVKSSLTDRETARLEAIKTLLSHPTWLSWRLNGPLMFRGYEKWSEDQGARQIAILREAYGNVRFVVGHTPTKNKKIHALFDNAVFMIDTGMSAMYYRGRPSVLEIRNGGIAAVYEDSRETFVAPTSVDAPADTLSSQSSTLP